MIESSTPNIKKFQNGLEVRVDMDYYMYVEKTPEGSKQHFVHIPDLSHIIQGVSGYELSWSINIENFNPTEIYKWNSDKYEWELWKRLKK